MYVYLKKYFLVICYSFVFFSLQSGEFASSRTEFLSWLISFAPNYMKRIFFNNNLKKTVASANNASPDPEGHYSDDDWEQIKYWIEEGADANFKLSGFQSQDLSIINDTFERIILKAIYEARPDIVEFLINRGSDVCSADKYGRYALYFVLKTKPQLMYYAPKSSEQTPERIRIMELLLAHGAKPDYLTTCQPETPLGVAARGGAFEYIRLLLRYGADPSQGLIDISYDKTFFKKEENKKNFFKLLGLLTEAGASWDFRYYENHREATLLHQMIRLSEKHRLSLDDIIEIIKLAPIYFLLKKNLIQDYPNNIGQPVLSYSEKINNVQEELFNINMPLPIAIPFLKELLPLNKILLNPRPRDVATKHDIVMSFLRETVLNLKELLAIPRKNGNTLLGELNLGRLDIDRAEDFRELLDGSRLDDDYKNFTATPSIYLLSEDNIVKGMYYNTVRFLKDRSLNLPVN